MKLHWATYSNWHVSYSSIDGQMLDQWNVYVCVCIYVCVCVKLPAPNLLHKWTFFLLIFKNACNILHQVGLLLQQSGTAYLHNNDIKLCRLPTHPVNHDQSEDDHTDLKSQPQAYKLIKLHSSVYSTHISCIQNPISQARHLPSTSSSSMTGRTGLLCRNNNSLNSRFRASPPELNRDDCKG